MFGKRVADLRRDDIERIVKEELQEGQDLELKEALSAENGLPDPWMADAQKIGKYARDRLLDEIVAFANSFGGTLVLGIAETDEKPPRAAKITPIPRCADLAERLKLQCRDGIEPRLPGLEIAGVATEKDAGVIVIRVPRSRQAPHRQVFTRECYARHGDRSEKMTMREIQELTLNVERGLSAIEARFSERATRFRGYVGRSTSFGLRATLVPMSPIHVNRVHRVADALPMLNDAKARTGANKVILMSFPMCLGRWRPVLRGARSELSEENELLWCEATNDGLIEYAYLRGDDDSNSAKLYPGWLLTLIANSLVAVERFRRQTDQTETEYGLEFEIEAHTGSNLPVHRYDMNHVGGPMANMPAGRHVFPRYLIGGPADFPEITSLFEQDLWNLCGRDWDDTIKVDFAQLMQRLWCTTFRGFQRVL